MAGKCLEEIDAQNASTISGSLDLRQCPRLRNLLLAGTSLANIYPPVGGRLLRVQYPDTLSTLFMHSLNLLTEDNIEISDAAKANISTIYINSCDNINAFAFLRSVYNAEGSRLANIGVIWKGVVEDNEATTMVMLGDIAKNAGVEGGYRGVTYNDNGEIISQSVPNISGTIHVNYPVYVADVEAVAQAHIPLTINYDEDKVYVPFADDAVKKICATKWGDGVGLTYTKAAAVTSLGTKFKGNTEITEFMELSKFGVTAIAQNDFNGCTNLNKIDLSKITVLNSNSFRGCTSLNGIILPTSLTTIGDDAFKNCTSLAIIIDLPNLKDLGQGAFDMDYTKGSLVGIENLGKITTLLPYCFRSQKSLTYAKLPNTLTTIKLSAFYNCSALANVTLPTSLTTIGDSAFEGCSSLVTFICNATTPPTLASVAFNRTPISSKKGTIYVPDASVDAYKAATNWVNYASIIKPLSEYVES